MAVLYTRGRTNATFNGLIAHLPFVVARVRAEARGRAKIAEARLAAAKHRTGDSRITVTFGDVDAFINLDDTRGAFAAAAIEYGRPLASGEGRSRGIGALQAAMGAG